MGAWQTYPIMDHPQMMPMGRGDYTMMHLNWYFGAKIWLLVLVATEGLGQPKPKPRAVFLKQRTL